MRTAFVKELTRLAEQNDRIFFITGDLGFGVMEDYAERFPAQYLNAGVAEQNMTGVAAGLAHTGRIVFTYSIANFPTIRALEQVRNDVCYHNLDVKIVSVGGGLAYGSLGYSHHAVEDVAIMRSLPNMCVIAPGDPIEAAAATRAAVARPGPVYLRLGKAGEPAVHAGEIDFEIGRAILMRDGRDATIISTGGMLHASAAAAERLHVEGMAVRHLSMHTVKPLDIDAVEAAARETGRIVVVEEHSATGGLFAAVAETLLRAGLAARVEQVSLPPGIVREVGSQDYLRGLYGLTADGIRDAVRRIVCA
ncbi:MAG TPA: transketolase C-terminal domain-containing protein [Actinomycetota bacterium]|nr:transketolase C-terminal domain-containing protein [Actinomycetota bacterium]